MTRRAGRKRARAGRGTWSLAAAALLAVGFASLVRDTYRAPSAAHAESASPTAPRDAALASTEAAHAAAHVVVAFPSIVQALPTADRRDAAPRAESGTCAGQDDDDRAACELSAAPAPDDAAPRGSIPRSPKPARHAALATRLGWTEGDGRESRLASWLEGEGGRACAAGRGGPPADLIALFGAADAAAIAQDLAPLTAGDER